jgi:hypothetical protein
VFHVTAFHDPQSEEHGPVRYLGSLPAGKQGTEVTVRDQQPPVVSCRPWSAAVRGQLPMVGVPDPIAIAKTCSAVMPSPTPALTVGSVTEATVLPAASGTDAK